MSNVRLVAPETHMPVAWEVPTVFHPDQDVPPLISTILVPEDVSAIWSARLGTLEVDVVGMSATPVTVTPNVAVMVLVWFGIGALFASNSDVVRTRETLAASPSEFVGGRKATDPMFPASTRKVCDGLVTSVSAPAMRTVQPAGTADKVAWP